MIIGIYKENRAWLQKDYPNKFLAARHETSPTTLDSQVEDVGPSALNEVYIILTGSKGGDTYHAKELATKQEVFHII